MKRIASTLTAAALAVGAGAGLVATAGEAVATGTPTPWIDSSGNSTDTAAVGGLAFFDSAGAQITSGPTSTAPFASYVAGLATLRAGDNKAQLSLWTPQVGDNPGAWSKASGIGSAGTFPNASAPSPVKDTALPVYTGTSSNNKLDTLAAAYPASTTTGYANIYELRLTTGSSGNPNTDTYDFADIKIDSTTHTWSLVYTPDQKGKATTSTLAADKASVNTGDTVHLTDTVAPADTTDPGTVSGTVQFKDGSSNVGQAVTVTGGKAEADVKPSTGGTHNYTAVFLPKALGSYATSTSNAVPVAAKVVVPDSSVALAVNPSSAPAYTSVKLTATVSPTVGGTVKFFDSNAQIGQVAVTTGTATASLDYNSFAEGTHSLTATFTPDNATDANPSTSQPVSFVATASTAPAPDDQTITTDVAAGSLAITTPYTPDKPLNLGTMTLNDSGTMLSATAQFGDGTIASYGTKGPNGKGSIQVIDTRPGNGNWVASAQSRDLSNGAGTINAQNVGLTGLKTVVLAGNALQSLKLTDNPAASPAVAPGAAGTAGLGGTPHEFARTTNGGNGSIGVYGTLTVTAPTSTKAGHYTGIITFTVMGSTTG